MLPTLCLSRLDHLLLLNKVLGTNAKDADDVAQIIRRLPTNESLKPYALAIGSFPSSSTVVDAVVDCMSDAIPCGESIKLLLTASHGMPASTKCRLLDAIRNVSAIENPAHISFGGDKESFLGVMCTMNLGAGLALSMWIKIDDTANSKGFLLARCRTSTGGLDCIFSDRIGNAWTVTIRSYSDRNGVTEKLECKGTASIKSNSWTHILFAHNSGDAKEGRINMFINGVKDIDHVFPSPFGASVTANNVNNMNYFPQSVQWAVGVGLKGAMASTSIYAAYLSPQLVSLIYQAGFETTDLLSAGIGCPQSSFDTGYMTLSSRLIKGPAACELNRMHCVVALSPRHFLEAFLNRRDGMDDVNSAITVSLLPENLGLVQGSETIEFAPSSVTTDTPITLTIAPGCRLHRLDCSGPSSWKGAWFAAGGAALLLYALQADLLADSQTGATSVYREQHSGHCLSLAKRWMCLLTTIAVHSLDIREQLLQMHGFHVIGAILSSHFNAVKNEESNIDVELVHICADLLGQIGYENEKGDFVAAVLQGVLLNMSLWANAAPMVKSALLSSVVGLLGPNIGEELRRNFGVQAILDMIRLNFLCSDGSIEKGELSDEAESIINPCYTSSLVILQKLFEVATDVQRVDPKAIANYIYSLLALMDECRDPHMLLCCCKVIFTLRKCTPQLLFNSLIEHRFTDTTSLNLLTAKGVPNSVRRDVLALCLWIVSEPNQQSNLSSQLVALRKKIVQLENANAVGLSARDRKGWDSNAKAINTLNAELAMLSKQMHRSWMTISMLADVVTVAMNPRNNETSGSEILVDDEAAEHELQVADLCKYGGNWGKEIDVIAACNELLEIFYGENSLNARFDLWLMLPMLPALLGHCDLDVLQRVLMAVVVSLKTDDAQVECLCSLPDDRWVLPLVRICLLGEQSFKRRPVISALASVVGGDCDLVEDSSFERVDHRTNIDESELARDVHFASDPDNQSRASTCRELALDSLATLLEHKMRTQSNDAWNSWMTVVALLEAEGSHLELPPDSDYEHVGHDDLPFRSVASASSLSLNVMCSRLLNRLLALVLQRLSRSSEGWSLNMLPVMHSVVSLLRNALYSEFERYFQVAKCVSNVDESNDIHRIDKIDRSGDGVGSSFGQSKPQTSIVEAEQALFFLFDCFSSLRRQSEKRSVSSNSTSSGASMADSIVLLSVHGLQVILLFLKYATVNSVDRMCNEILSALQFFLHCESSVLTADQFKDILLSLFSACQSAISAAYSVAVSERIVVLVFLICHQFLDLRQTTRSYESIRAHVLPTLEAMTGIDACADVDVIFRLVEVKLCTANTISFDELPEPANDDTSRRDGAPPVSSQKQGITDELLLEFEDDEHGNQPVAVSGPKTGETFCVDNGNGSDHSVQGIVTADSTRHRRSRILVDPAHIALAEWIRPRKGIISDRVQLEQARLSRQKRAKRLSDEGVGKFWARLSRKIATEILRAPLSCQWKLGVAHEGSFFGRKRLVTRPQYQIRRPRPVDTATDAEDFGHGPSECDDEIRQRLAQAIGGRIADVRSDGSESEDAVAAASSTMVGNSSSSLSSSSYGTVTANSGADDRDRGDYMSDWGLVGPDGTDDGFAVIGSANISSALAGSGPYSNLSGSSQGGSIVSPLKADHPSAQSSALNGEDIAGVGGGAVGAAELVSDHQLVDELMRRGRGSDTGPNYCGAKRAPGSNIASARVILVTASGSFAGVLTLSKKELFFSSSAKVVEGAPSGDDVGSSGNSTKIRRRRWVVAHICAVYLRRFRLRDTAMEVFFKRGKHKHFFVDFGHTTDNQRIRNEFSRAVMNHSPPAAFKQWAMLSQYRLVPEHNVTEKWINRQMSNFEYLMALNTISGRSFNDLCQYPVMPWVLTQFTDSGIDLSDPSVYRDLSKPMGALNPQRLNDFLDRYESFAESVTMDIPPFMYGSHYSTMVGVVLHFLVRLQPFASLHMEMQNGRFDVSDRLFSSVARTFSQNTTQLSEVKELTPEWFTTPDMFTNHNHFDFGKTQDGTVVGDVELPPWARGSAAEFVRIHREALESEYVSAHLHEWIDLIFGYKQRGPAAVEACNVFYYLTYAGSVDRSLIEDESLRKATELQIAHFGQVPLQLFKSPHPSRAPAKVASLSNSTKPRILSQCYSSLASASTHDTTLSAAASGGSAANKKAASLLDVEDSLLFSDDILLSSLSGSAAISRHNKYIHNSGKHELGAGNNGLLGNIYTCIVGKEAIVCLLDSGVLETYRYATSESAKSILSSASQARIKYEQSLKVKEAQLAQNQLPPDLMNSDMYGSDLVLSSSVVSPPSSSSPLNPSSTGGGLAGSMEISLEMFNQFLADNGTIIELKKSAQHFDMLPRVSLGKAPLPVTNPIRGLSVIERAAGLVAVSANRRIVLTGGHSRGAVSCRHVNHNNGLVFSCADFVAHKDRVVALSCDIIAETQSVVAVSADIQGTVLVWTLFQLSRAPSTSAGIGSGSGSGSAPGGSGGGAGASSGGDSYQSDIHYGVSRRPQRLFRVKPCGTCCVDLSWNMGIVAYATDRKIQLFSIERDELIRCIDIGSIFHNAEREQSIESLWESCCDHASQNLVNSTSVAKEILSDCVSSTNCGARVCCFMPEDLLFAEAAAIQRMCLSAEGFVIFHICYRRKCPSPAVPVLHESDRDQEQCVLCSMTLSGSICGLYSPALATRITHVSCPNRAAVVCVGNSNGIVVLLHASNLATLHVFDLTAFSSVVCSPSLSVSSVSPSTAAGAASAGQQGGSTGSSRQFDKLPTSGNAVLSVALGPDPSNPAVLVASTATGYVCVQPLPDYVSWERYRNPSKLQQLVNRPLAAVSRTIQQAQNITAWTSEQAETLAQNASALAQDTLKKIKRNSIISGVGNLFGMRKNDN